MKQTAFGVIVCLLCSDWSPRWVDVCVCVMQQRRRVRPQLVRDVDRSRADIENNDVYKKLCFCSRQAQVALEASVCFSCVGERECRFSHPELSLQLLDPWKRVAFRGVTREEDGYHHF